MATNKIYFLVLFLFINVQLHAQRFGTLSGNVTDKNNLKPIIGASVQLTNGPSVITDSAGQFAFNQLAVGSYTIIVTSVGYRDFQLYNLVITSGNQTTLNIELEGQAKELNEVTVESSRRTARAATLENPLSVQRLTTEEIRSNPGGNFDISRVIQTLPGVGGTAGSVGGFRNDIIIRGGAPNENVFYLDGIEVPVINHFATQGSAGGPTGILNVSFIEDVKLSSSAFDARYDNALSSVFQFRQKVGNPDRVQGNFRLSGTEVAATLEGPINGERTTFLASARRSYLQFLFKAIDLPIRPNYWDFQYKITHKISSKTTLTLLGIGAIDEFSFAEPRSATPEKLYVLNSNPTIEQWNYTVGASIRHQLKNGYLSVALSRNMLENRLDKFEDNQSPKEEERMLQLRSQEIENKLRVDINKTIGNWKFSYGGVAQLADYNNRTFNRIRKELVDETGTVVQPAETVNFSTPLSDFWRLGAFIQAGKRFFDDRLGISAGIRTDGNTFTEDGMDFSKTLSPRLSLSYVLANRWTWNSSIGRYFKIPPYTILGFANNNGVLVNKDAAYIRSDHYVTGIEFLPSPSLRFTIEGFYKRYASVPVSVRDGISLSNLGGDFNVLGNEAITSTGKGRAYGIEFFAQQKLTKHLFGILSYTYFKSKYSGTDGKYIASAWDNNHLLSITTGYKLGRNWELGLKFRFQGGAPYTPFDETASRINYLSTGTGLLDYNRLNTLRLKSFHASDIRIDKKWNFRRLTLDAFIDLTNWYAAKSPGYPQYTFQRNADNTAFVTTDGAPIKPDGSNAIPYILDNEDTQITPTIGFIVEF
jgi:outer membrane receptor for ferrienterochelin and colicin